MQTLTPKEGFAAPASGHVGGAPINHAGTVAVALHELHQGVRALLLSRGRRPEAGTAGVTARIWVGEFHHLPAHG